MKVLLCLLSDQHVPNLLSVHHFRPDHLVLIESVDMQKRGVANNFLSALREGRTAYELGHNCEVQSLAAVSDFGAIADALKSAFGSHPTADWIANLAGGTRPMSIAAYEFFKAVGARLVYVEVTRPDQIIDVQSGQIEKVEHELSIVEFLRGYGFVQNKDPREIEKAESQARDWWDLARAIAQFGLDDCQLRLDDDRRELGRKKGLMIQPRELIVQSDRLRDMLADQFNLTEKDGGLTGQVNRYAVKFLTGGWLEVFLWGLLDRHSRALCIHDVRMGIEPQPHGKTAPNDFDIAFMRDYSLSMVECKSGSQSHDKGGDALYKVEAVIKQFRALRVRSYFASTAENILETDKDGKLVVKEVLANRGEVYGCSFVTRPDIQKLAAAPDDGRTVEIAFKWKKDSSE